MKAKEAFAKIKDAQITTDKEDLENLYLNALRLVQKYELTGQEDGLRKLVQIVSIIEKEQELVELGYTKYVDSAVVNEYVDKVAQDDVRIIELSRFEREIPDDIVSKIEEVKDIFDEMIVVFTDYSGVYTDKAHQEEIEKDPILFGVFTTSNTVSERVFPRMYYIGDWVDEYCDLTLEKMVSEIDKDVVKNTDVQADIESLKEGLDHLLNPKVESIVPDSLSEEVFEEVKKEGFFKNIVKSVKGLFK